ncbi:MAG: elongation factor 4 [Candidatus Taylorbacteria bacterium CG11_big_fil_rev_8_21_14_0_20_46_11]|uniref:Elongation factor 4 n=1 Tax=Candidatus Taylorbacteria bacterium CG11_big_fil_rev_8_21_14_0_20_46_11 TaxID=1975025 RepID=A0A2H0KA65_9BACT|nr:MAG: elongation factor 4 [Candidatus Taylorbacteria bacterium CG11_big_fil_rev_8_21_14_0_20_46_11]
MQNIRNFCIIAHIDHGKSTLADRLLELTGTIEKRKMQNQVLDDMELERERGITIKMTPVRMFYTLHDTRYTFNLIDTPGHIDFAYEVSRAMKAVEGAIVLVDATQGVQAQTISVLNMAKEAGLTIIPAINKIDSPLAQVSETVRQIAELCGVDESSVLKVSGKTGEGVENLLQAVVDRVPPPHIVPGEEFRGLVFDFKYSNHAGVIVYLRSFDGSTKKGDKLRFAASEQVFTVLEAGIFSPGETLVDALSSGEIGYLITGVKEPGIASVGDTILTPKGTGSPLPGYDRPKPVVWASIYPESQDDFDQLRQAINRLRLSDSSFTYEEESGGLLGRGFRCGFLGMLHLEIITERLHREFNLTLVVTTPSITYEVVTKQGKREVVYSAARFPEYGEVMEVHEPWVEVRIITPAEYIEKLMPMLYEHEAFLKVTENFGDHRHLLIIEMPLRELMRGFFDDVKSSSSGFASLSYSILELRKADVVKLEILVAEEIVQAFSRIVSRKRVEMEAESAVEKLSAILPRQMFATKVQGQALGRIMSSRTVRPMQKTLGDFGKNGGDRTRKMKLWQNQKEGKKRLKEQGVGKVRIPHEVFLKMVRKD